LLEKFISFITNDIIRKILIYIHIHIMGRMSRGFTICLFSDDGIW